MPNLAHPSQGSLLLWSIPFVLLLLCIAIFPLVPRLSHWWEHNHNKLIVALALALVTCIYYLLRSEGFHGAAPGLPSLGAALDHAILRDYFPFIVLLFSLYTISGGIRLVGDVPAHPLTNLGILLSGAALANLIGTTGASMVLIRPLLQINSERRRVTHTVVFFIFLVSNIGGTLLPVGDPPLFLGYLRGVPFFWTLNLLPQWLTCIGILAVVYWVFDSYFYRREEKSAINLDEATRVPVRLEGKINFLLLAGVVAAVALLVPGRTLLLTGKVLPNFYLREIAQIALAVLSLMLTPASTRRGNEFNFFAINEVAALFIGIFITMQVPIELLHLTGPELPLQSAMRFFWATGLLSSVLDNAPTYIVMFEIASTLPADGVNTLSWTGGQIAEPFLIAISLGSVFMGANSYIGNGPNFLVRSIAESRGVRMPSFMGYMLYSGCILTPIFLVISLIFFR